MTPILSSTNQSYFRDFYKVAVVLLCISISLSSCSSSKNLTKLVPAPHHDQLRTHLVDYSKSYLGIPYKYGGRSIDSLDCSGLTSLVFAKEDIKLPPTSSLQATFGKRIPRSELKAGDLAFFGSHGKVTHVAMVTKVKNDQIFVIHSTSSKGVSTTEILSNAYWKKILIEFRNVVP